MRQSDLALEKYCVTQSGYFRLAPTLMLGMYIIDGKILDFNGIAEEIEDKKYNERVKRQYSL